MFLILFDESEITELLFFCCFSYKVVNGEISFYLSNSLHIDMYNIWMKIVNLPNLNDGSDLTLCRLIEGVPMIS